MIKIIKTFFYYYDFINLMIIQVILFEYHLNLNNYCNLMI